jgi:hypothetical protein
MKILRYLFFLLSLMPAVGVGVNQSSRILDAWHL